jgi:hypothetical protein
VLTNATAGFGSAICSAGDVNGNGRADIAIGAPGGNTVRIHHGSGVAVSAAPSLILNGPGGSGFGTSVSTAGDVNSDGYADLIVGAPGSGQAYVYLGSGAGLSPVPHVVLTGTGEFGYSVSTAGDVNGDGYSDVIVGAPSASNGQAGEGLVYIYHGSMTGMVNVPAAVLEVNVANARFGHRVTNAGDVNGDGYFDVAIGAPQWASGQANEGGVFVYRGSATGITTVGAVTLQRNIVNGNMGLSLQEAGDLNGDGYADIAVGAPLSETSVAESDEGLVYIYRGSQSGISAALIDALQSNTANAQLSFSVAGAGDVDGDGYSDLLVGAPGITATFAGEGTAQWYRGGSARGIVRPTRQYLADLVSPLSTNSMDFSAPDFFGLGHFARNPIHRCDARLQWEVVFEGQPFSGLPITNSVAQSGTSAGWTGLPTTGAEIKELIYKTPNFIRYKWRVRVEYELAKMIDGQRFSRWFYGYATGHGDIGVLPVELIDLTGEARREGNLISWRTASEHLSERFVVERSTDGTSFREIGALPAAGESIVLTEYSYLDVDAPHGIAYYRLNMIDLDGTQEYSPVIAVRRGGGEVTLYPVPAADELFVGFGERVEHCSVTVIDDVGRPAITLQWGAITSGEVRRIGVQQLAPGHYTLMVQDGNGTTVARRPFVKR